jgi:hypothetical protein
MRDSGVYPIGVADVADGFVAGFVVGGAAFAVEVYVFAS